MLVFTIRAPRGAKVRGKWVIVPRIKRENTWIDYAPLMSLPSMEFVSRSSFAPLYIETDFENYIYVYGSTERNFTSAIASMTEPF